MHVKQLVLYNDHVEVLRDSPETERSSLYCPFSRTGEWPELFLCGPQCPHFGDYRRVIKDKYKLNQGVKVKYEIHIPLTCTAGNTEIICDNYVDFADLRGIKKETKTC